MNILFISAVLPYPLYSGGQIRIYQLLKRLSKKHKITLLSFIRSSKERKYLKELSFLNHVETIYRGKAFQLKYLLGALGNYSWLLSTYNNKEMKRIINHELITNNYDLIHIEPFYVYPSLPKFSIPLVVGEHNVEYSIYEQYVRKFPLSFLRPFLFSDVIKTRIWEESVWKKASALIAVSDEDKRVMESVRKDPIAVIPNGVDCAHYTYVQRTIEKELLRCLFIGDFAWVPNKEAVSMLLRSIWPKIVLKYPTATLTIVGKQFPKTLRSFLKKSITYIKRVDDIKKIYDTHAVLLAPMGIAGGSKFKLLEAMASGMIVFTTKEGRMGLFMKPGVDLIEAEHPDDYVQALDHICANPKETLTMTKHAREIIEKQYHWDAIAESLDTLWRSCI